MGAGGDLHRGRLPGPIRDRPQVMACLRNLAIGVLCRAGPVNLAAALRFHSRDPHRPLATLGISLGVGTPSQLPGDDARAAPDAATSKPTSLAERRACGMLRSQTSGAQPSRRWPVVPSLSSQAILMDYCLEVRASGFTRMLAGRGAGGRRWRASGTPRAAA